MAFCNNLVINQKLKIMAYSTKKNYKKIVMGFNFFKIYICCKKRFTILNGRTFENWSKLITTKGEWERDWNKTHSSCYFRKKKINRALAGTTALFYLFTDKRRRKKRDWELIICLFQEFIISSFFTWVKDISHWWGLE